VDLGKRKGDAAYIAAEAGKYHAIRSRPVIAMNRQKYRYVTGQDEKFLSELAARRGLAGRPAEKSAPTDQGHRSSRQLLIAEN